MSMTTPSTTAAATGTSSTAGTAASQALGKDDFLKLLTAQLRHQDPMNPVGDTEFIAQMAQFATLEQVTNLSGEVSRLGDSAWAQQSISMIGRTVTYLDETGNTVEGTVEAVSFDRGAPSLTIDVRAGIAPAYVVEVA
jgi:flagellar basal-body rod modification protein FlgD